MFYGQLFEEAIQYGLFPIRSSEELFLNIKYLSDEQIAL
jgi:hypothetical protein